MSGIPGVAIPTHRRLRVDLDDFIDEPISDRGYPCYDRTTEDGCTCYWCVLAASGWDDAEPIDLEFGSEVVA